MIDYSNVDGGKGVWYVYRLVDPNTNETRYVGMTKDPKKRCHTHKTERSRNGKKEWIKSLPKGPKMVLISTHKDKFDAQYHEYMEIEKAAKEGAKLFNKHRAAPIAKRNISATSTAERLCMCGTALSGRQKTCSTRCRARAHRIRHRFVPYKRQCLMCDRMMDIKNKQSEKRLIYCSGACRQKAYRERKRIKEAIDAK